MQKEDRFMERRHDAEYKKLGLNIAYYRKERGLSQMQLAEKIDISRTHMSRIENNDCAVHVVNKKRIKKEYTLWLQQILKEIQYTSMVHS